VSELRRILLADDNANDVELTLAALRAGRLAYEVDVVRDGAEALAYLRRPDTRDDRARRHPAVVLLDLKMPKVDGLEVLRQLKSDPVLKVIPVVVLTSSREESDLLRSYDLGANAYVVKPGEFQALIDAVKLLGGFWAVLNEPPPARSSEGGRHPL